MKKRLKVFLIIGVMLFILPANALAKNEPYYVNEALGYAKQHWNDYKGGCIVFVTDAFKPANIILPQFLRVSKMVDYLEKNDYGKIYKMQTTDIKGDKTIPAGKTAPRTADNQNTARPGDLLFWYCSKCKTYTHVGILGDDKQGCLSIYAHNLAENNSRPVSANCIEHGIGDFVEIHVMHMNNATIKTGNESKISIDTVVSIEMGKGEKISVNTGDPKAPIVYKSSDEKTIAITKKGLVTAKKTGKATITGQAQGQTKLYVINIEVLDPPGKAWFEEKEITIRVGEELTVKPLLDGVSYFLDFSSSDRYTARVDQLTGKIYGIKKGRCEIRVKTFNGKTAKYIVNVAG